MTIQAKDTVEFINREWFLLTTSHTLNFPFEKFGLTPEEASTACYRGNIIKYSVGIELVIKTIFINCKENNPINGISPSEIIDEIRMKRYEEVKMSVTYTGGIIVSRGWNQYQSSTGLYNFWQYDNSSELIFENGTFIEANNLNNLTKQIRSSGDFDKSLGFNFESPNVVIKLLKENLRYAYTSYEKI